MPITSGQVTVGTSATAVITNNSGSVQELHVAVPSGGQDVFFGGSGVTTSNGFTEAGGTELIMDIEPGDTLYGVVAASTQSVSYLLMED